MTTLQTNYQALVTEENEVPHESVIFHAASEGGKPHWNHIGDLDTFFKNIYEYHQKHGYKCIMFAGLFKKLIMPFLIIFGFAYFLNGVFYNFDEAPSPVVNKTDINLLDLFLSIPDTIHNFGIFSWILVIIGFFYCLWGCYKLWQTHTIYDDIRQFYTSAMKIDESKISHVTWHEVQCRLREVQHEQQMCVHKSDLTELDISHRILRHKNYLIAMVNKNILPLKYNIKFFGEWIYMTTAFENVINITLFSRFSPVFKETGKLSDEYKRYARRKETASSLEKFITTVAVLTAIFCVPALVYNIIAVFLKYAAEMKFNPINLSRRHWSKYARCYLRHFNELDHELEARLARAYKPATEYMKSFNSPLTVVLARPSSRICGAVAVFIFLWGLYKEKLFTVGGVLILMTIASLLFLALNALIPDENTIYFPKRLMKKIIAEIHYVPDHFKENAQLPAVRDEFSHLFPLRIVSIIDEALSIVILPYILYFVLRPKSLEIVDFFRNFTVEVSGVGDVCSFALMDVSKHGNNQWHTGVHTKVDQDKRAEGGKTELSLIHFQLMNPDWKPPPSSDVFINDFRQRVTQCPAKDGPDFEDAYYTSLNSFSSMGSKYASLVNSIHNHHQYPGEYQREHHAVNIPDDAQGIGAMSGGLSLAEGPPYLGPSARGHGGFLSSQIGEVGSNDLLQADPEGLNPLEVRAADMSFSALYLHEVHQRLIGSPSTSQVVHHQPSQESENNGNETSPLLDVQVANYVQ